MDEYLINLVNDFSSISECRSFGSVSAVRCAFWAFVISFIAKMMIHLPLEDKDIMMQLIKTMIK